MKTLRRVFGAMLVIAGGMLIYDLAVGEALIEQTIPLLLLLVAQVLLGGFAGQLMRWWGAVALAPAAFAIGFLSANPLQSSGVIAGVPATGNGSAVAALAAGDVVLGTAFMLTLLCCLLAVGVAVGTTRGIRRQHWARSRRALARRAQAQPLAAASVTLASVEPISASSAASGAPAQRELVHA